MKSLTTETGLGAVSNIIIGLSIEPDSTVSFGLEINYDRWDVKNNLQQLNIFDYTDSPNKKVLLPNKRSELENELWINFSFEKKFKRERVLKLSLNAGGENEINFSKSEDTDLTSLPSNVQQFLKSSDELESQKYYSLITDYEFPFFKLGTVETGLKADLINYAIFQHISLRSDTISVPDNNFNMNMQKLGAYVIQKNRIKKIEYAIGMRLEQFKSNALQKTDSIIFTQTYIRLFPSIQFNYLLTERQQTIGFSYTRRINRPGFFDLNPYVSYEDPLNLETGNPTLRPEIGNLFELNYHKEWKRLLFDLTLYNRNTKDAIQPIVGLINNNRSLATSANIGKANSRGIEVQFEYRSYKIFKTSATFLCSQSKYEELENKITFNKQTTWALMLKQNWSFKKNWRLELSEVYKAPSFQIQQKTHQNYYVNIGGSKKFNNNRGSLSLSVRDVFNTRQYKYALSASNFEIERNYKWQTRQITLGFKYIIIDKK